jgi:predicted AAA+ superfamily ATPase
MSQSSENFLIKNNSNRQELIARVYDKLIDQRQSNISSDISLATLQVNKIKFIDSINLILTFES